MAATYAKDPQAVLDFTFDWTGYLDADETIASYTVTVDDGLTHESDNENTPGVIMFWVSGGTAGTTYTARCRITTNLGRTDERGMFIHVTDDVDVTAGTWATTVECEAITGVSPTNTLLMQAQHLIENVTGRTYESTDATTKDGGWLRKAVAYQAAYMASHPELFTLADVAELRQGSASERTEAKFRGPMSGYLAPLARRALANLRRGGSHTVRVASVYETAAHAPWRPIG